MLIEALFKDGAVSLVTGSSKGIGRAIAVELAKNGAEVIINYSHNLKEAETTAVQIEESGGRSSIIHADVSDEKQVREMFRKIKKDYKRLDILVNNAGIIHDGYLMMMGSGSFSNVMKVNLGGCFNCTQNALRMMCSEKKGSIVNIASTSGIVGQEGQCNYSASKGAIISFTKSVAKEYARYNVRANAVAPGFILTDMTLANRKLLEEKYKGLIPMKRFGDPIDVAYAVSFLASDWAAYITGRVITVDGGLIM